MIVLILHRNFERKSVFTIRLLMVTLQHSLAIIHDSLLCIACRSKHVLNIILLIKNATVYGAFGIKQ